MRNLPGIVLVVGSALVGLLQACRPSGPSAAGVPALVSAASSSPAVASSAPAEPEPKVEFIPLHKPEHWKMVAIPDANNMGKTTPCPMNPDWGELGFSFFNLLPDKNKAEEYCSSDTPVIFPVCTEEQMSRAVKLDAIMKGKWGVSPPEWDEKGTHIYWSFRGYLRRNFLFEPSRLGPMAWDIQLRSFNPLHGCSSVKVAPTSGYICYGGRTISCCRSSLVDTDVEVLLEMGFYTGMQLCVIPGQEQKPRVQTFLRSIEEPAPLNPKEHP